MMNRVMTMTRLRLLKMIKIMRVVKINLEIFQYSSFSIISKYISVSFPLIVSTFLSIIVAIENSINYS